jgi:hypothetical protein
MDEYDEVRPAMDQHVSRLYGGDDSPVPRMFSFQ